MKQLVEENQSPQLTYARIFDMVKGRNQKPLEVIELDEETMAFFEPQQEL